MSHVIAIVVYTMIAGLAIPAGAAIARIERLHPNWLEREFRHGVMAFGGGILLAAVALVLVPEGIRHLSAATAIVSLLTGGAVFLVVDRTLTRKGTPMSMLLAALLDFMPEAIALGALITSQPSIGPLLAFFITLQNVPEGFNAHREMVHRGHMESSQVLSQFLALALLGPICGLLGLWALADAPFATGVVMLFASGGILYLTFQDIAPQSVLRNHWGPPLGAVLGFAIGLLGHMIILG